MSIMFILRIILVVLLCIPIWEMFRFLYKKHIREYNDIRVDKSREQRKDNHEKRAVDNSRRNRWRR